jgi:hypothetical protein
MARISLQTGGERIASRLEAIRSLLGDSRGRRTGREEIADHLHPGRVAPAVREMLAAGLEYLERTHGAYRHALELSGLGPELLEHAAALSAAIEAYELRQAPGHRQA